MSLVQVFDAFDAPFVAVLDDAFRREVGAGMEAGGEPYSYMHLTEEPEWEKPINAAIWPHFDTLTKPFRGVRGLDEVNRIQIGLCLRTLPVFDKGPKAHRVSVRWHRDHGAKNGEVLRLIWYGGDFEGGELEVKKRLGRNLRAKPAHNSLVCFNSANVHRRRPVLRGVRLAMIFGLMRPKPKG